MAVYKVPQDVEADDKLIGPFSFRQFIYLIIVAIAMFLAWMLSQLFIGLIIIPLPIILFFGALALPLRKDQPMEIYLTAVIKFFLKPKTRLWNPDGSINMVTITAPQVDAGPLTKGYSGDEARQRLAYLSQIVDTRGWASRGVTSAPPNLSDIVVAEAQATEDIMDDNANVAQNFNSLIAREDTRRRQSAVNQIQQASQQQPLDTSAIDEPAIAPSFNPYPSSMHQKIIGGREPLVQRIMTPRSQPITTPRPAPEPTPTTAQPTPSQPAVSPDTIRLANNNDLTISAIAREAHRLEAKGGEEVVISLR